MPLEQAISEQRELIERHFMSEGAILGSQKFAALHRSQVRNGTFLYIPRGDGNSGIEPITLAQSSAS